MVRKPLAPAFILCVVLAASARAGDIIDRIVATVNNRAILQSDWEEAVCYEALLGGRPLDKIGPEDRRAALNRLIDQELLREQVHSSDLATVSRDQLDQRVKEIRKLYPAADTEQAWQTILRRYWLSEDKLASRLAGDMDLMRLVESRLRPSVQIDPQSVEIYYRDVLVPQVRASGARQAPLAEVTSKIKDVLSQQKINDLLSSWLQNLRAGSSIRSPEVTIPTGDHNR